MTAALLRYEDIKVGAVYEFAQTVVEEEVLAFAEITGDHNPLHVDSEFGKQSQFGKNIVHGMLLGGLFSTLVGMYCPGENCLYMSQTLQFRKPVFYCDKVIVKGTVTEKSDGVRIITLKTEITKESEIMITGEAKVRVLK